MMTGYAFRKLLPTIRRWWGADASESSLAQYGRPDALVHARLRRVHTRNAMHYAAETTLAFGSVEKIMRDVSSGWLLRYLHFNGASFFFIAVYIHIFRGLYYGSYKAPRELLWILGCTNFLLMMGIAPSWGMCCPGDRCPFGAQR